MAKGESLNKSKKLAIILECTKRPSVSTYLMGFWVYI